MKLWHKLCALFSRRRLEREMAEEMQAHLDELTERNIAAGLSPEEARYAALRAFGGVEQIKERARDERFWVEAEQWGKDIGYALKGLSRARGFIGLALVVLALTIGLNTGLFSLLDTLVLKPLPFSAADELVRVTSVHRPTGRSEDISGIDFSDLRNELAAVASWSVSVGFNQTLTAEKRPPRDVRHADINAGFFANYGQRLTLGREFAVAEEQHAENHVVIDYRLWRTYFEGDPEIVGKTCRLNGVTKTIIGVGPADFDDGLRADVWEPVQLDNPFFQKRDLRNHHAVARLKHGVTLEKAQAELALVTQRLAREFPASHRDWEYRMELLRDGFVPEQARRMAWMLQGAAVLILLLGCINLAGLQAARGLRRRHEMAIRSALGASRGRLMRQAIIESLLLGLGGGVLGWAVANWGLDGLKLGLPATTPLLANARLDAAAFVFVVGGVLVVVLVIGLLPAWIASRTDPQDALRQGGSSTTSHSGVLRVRDWLLGAQTTLSVLLVGGAALLMAGYVSILRTDTGFREQDYVAFSFNAPSNYYAPEKGVAYYQTLLDKVRATPGVDWAVLATRAPFETWGYGQITLVDGAQADDKVSACLQSVSNNYFGQLGLSLRRGRLFDDRDSLGQGPVAVISESFARRAFPHEDPIGKRIQFRFFGEYPPAEIVGVVNDSRQLSPMRDDVDNVYLPIMQHPAYITSLMVGAKPGFANVVEAVQQSVWAVEPMQSFGAVRNSRLLYAQATAAPRKAVTFGVIAAVSSLVIAAIGLYSAVAYNMTLRRREIGLRLALGAMPRQVVTGQVGKGLRPALAGLMFGCVLLVLYSTWLEKFVANVASVSAMPIIVAVSLLLFVVLVACWFPARRATKVDPMEALRCE